MQTSQELARRVQVRAALLVAGLGLILLVAPSSALADGTGVLSMGPQ